MQSPLTVIVNTLFTGAMTRYPLRDAINDALKKLMYYRRRAILNAEGGDLHLPRRKEDNKRHDHMHIQKFKIINIYKTYYFYIKTYCKNVRDKKKFNDFIA